MLKATMGVQAYFKLKAVNADTGVERDLSGWFPNIVLNSGLDRMSQGVWIDRVMVGSGNSTPVATQTALDAFVASATSRTEAAETRQTTTSPYYYSFTSTWRFEQGVAAGNLSEIGLGWGNSACWNRALIKDTGGNPTTITVLANEYLDVYVEIRVYPPMADIVSTINLLDASNNVISTHTITARPAMSYAPPGAIPFSKVIQIGHESSLSQPLNIYSSGTLNGIATNISGSATSLAAPSSGLSYPNLRTCAYKLSIAIGTANMNHAMLLIISNLGRWKYEISPPISKNDTQTLEHNFQMSWDRYTP